MNPVTMIDWLPAGMQYISSTNGGVNVSNIITWPNFGPISPGQSKIIYLLARIKQSAEGAQNNRANVTAKSPTSLSYYAEDWENFTAHKVDLKLKKGANPKQLTLMQNVVFTINITNSGNTSLNPVKVVDTLPVGLTYVSDNQSGVAVGSTVTWANVGPIPAGGYKNISLTAQADGLALGSVVNNVVATGKPAVGCNISASASESVLIFKPSITITKTSDVSVGAPSTNVNFTLTVKNTGQVALNPVKVVDSLPIGLNYVTSGNGSAAGNIVTWSNIGPLSPGQTKQLWMVAHINGAAYGDLNNTVDVMGTPPTGANVTNQSYKIVTAQPASIPL